MGVLQVNVGSVSVPDWREIGCGGAAGSGFTAVSDHFNRANSSTTLGSPWTVVSAGGGGSPAWGISSNQAYCAASYIDGFGTVHSTLAYLDVGSGDVDITVTLAVPSNGNGVLLRLSGTSSFFIVNSTDITWVSGGGSVLHTHSSGFASGDVMRVLAVGSSIQVFKNGTSVNSITDTRNQTATRHGMVGDAVFAPSMRLDDFTIAPGVTATTGRLKLWDGTRWMREACDSDAGPTFTDNFNRANSTSSIAGAWNIWSGTAGISSNQGYFPTGPTYAYIDVGSAVQDITITNARDTTDGGSGIMVNYDPAAATAHALPQYGYVFNFDSSSSVAGLSNGPQNGLNAGTLTLTAWTAGSTTLRITSDGAGTITAYQNGVQVAQILPGEPTFTTLRGTCIAIFCNTSAATHDRWDDMTVLTGAEKHPLKMWDGTTWQTVACMTPA